MNEIEDKSWLIDVLVQQLKSGKYSYHRDIPEVFRDVWDTKEVAITERELGIRRIEYCGYDPILQDFYVCEYLKSIQYKMFHRSEIIEKRFCKYFSEFGELYDYVDGDIYTNSFFGQYVFSEEEIAKYHIDLDKIHQYPFDGEKYATIKPDKLNAIKHSEDEIDSFIVEWQTYFDACKTGEELVAIEEDYNSLERPIDVSFFLWNYINRFGEDSFEPIMEFIAKDKYPSDELIKAVGLVYGIERVKNRYVCQSDTLAESTKRNRKTKIRTMYRDYETDGLTTKERCFYSRLLYRFVVCTEYYYSSGYRIRSLATRTYVFIKNIDDLAIYLDNDFSNCNFSMYKGPSIDWNNHIYNERTIFPYYQLSNLKKICEKYYDSRWNIFYAKIQWIDNRNNIVFEQERSFRIWEEFVHFFEGDLSGADLFECENLVNLSSYEDINLEGARLNPKMMEKLGLERSACSYDEILQFDDTLKNEKETSLILSDEHNELEVVSEDSVNWHVNYITDIHLLHKFKNCKYKDDCENVIKDIVKGLSKEDDHAGVWLIGGDVSSDFEVFKLFVKELSKYKRYTKKVFILGNHELWPFEGQSLDEIVRKYREVLSEYDDMYLVHNEIFYIEDYTPKYIKEDEILKLSKNELRLKLRKSTISILGGIGFSGYNTKFNAEKGIYLNTITRNEEIEESKRFEKLYNKTVDCLYDKSVVIFTHMKLKDWCKEERIQSEFVYVSGHDHRNFFFDDGSTRIYADNQVGYYQQACRFKSFKIKYDYDYFQDYEDGIHEITRREYLDFYQGINMSLTYNRDSNKLYMLKKNGYYCFIECNSSGKLLILNGGKPTTLTYDKIEYYYENMDDQISGIKDPYTKYYSFQKKIAEAVKSIGGSGRIHGAIIDIDFFNHIFVDPENLNITPYFAENIINKIAYRNIALLLEKHNPELYLNLKRLDGNNDGIKLLTDRKNQVSGLNAMVYTETDIYHKSGVIKKMQRLNNNILSIWNDNISARVESAQPQKVEHHISTNTLVDKKYEEKLAKWAKIREQREQKR